VKLSGCKVEIFFSPKSEIERFAIRNDRSILSAQMLARGKNARQHKVCLPYFTGSLLLLPH
jgi:hypothetical protein